MRWRLLACLRAAMTTSLSVFVGRSISLPCAATTASHVVDHTLNIVYKSLGTYGHLNLKDYDHVVLWLDYFNKNLKRRQGRKVNRERAVFDPTVQELTEAARAAGLQFSDQEVNSEARYPRRSYVKSGYVMVAKKEGMKKSQMIDAVAEKMLQKRNRQKSSKK